MPVARCEVERVKPCNKLRVFTSKMRAHFEISRGKHHAPSAHLASPTNTAPPRLDFAFYLASLDEGGKRMTALWHVRIRTIRLRTLNAPSQGSPSGRAPAERVRGEGQTFVSTLNITAPPPHP